MLSIITPVYNCEKFIEFCIENVIEQKSPLEHIIVDGGSTDKTVEIIIQYAEKYSHIRWISETDKGQSDAINKGIKMAKGKILGILNCDDFYQPNTLNHVLNIFQELQEPALLVGNCNVLDDTGNICHVNKPNNLKLLSLLLGKSHFPYNPSAYFYHKSLHQKVGFYKVDEHYAMDIDFLIKAVQNANVRYIDEIWGNYRHIAGTKTFTSMQSEHHAHNLKRILNEHKKNLPLRQKFQLNIINLLNKLEYYISNPQECFPRIYSKIKNVI